MIEQLTQQHGEVGKALVTLYAIKTQDKLLAEYLLQAEQALRKAKGYLSKQIKDLGGDSER